MLGYKTLALISRVCKAWKHTPIILVFGRLRQEDREFKTSLGYIESSRAALRLYETLDKRRGVRVGGGNEDKKGKEERKREGERENRPRSKSLFLSFAALTSSNE